jgi:hypothetical protein
MLFDFSTIGNRRVGTQMRIPLVGCVLLAALQPSFAQKLLTTEPLMLDPYAVVFVNDGSCSSGKILEVTGVIRGLHRKKSCVPAMPPGPERDELLRKIKLFESYAKTG